ncbi:MAG: hypothetical protein A2261_03020 [Candidatus Magasanikbacteria bacterium RIFOXYA2_FULL_44_8]|uniref:Thioredoxin-like fold domain-containing protein n=1 Tax=Candidatus Magasanikbacteria bacterium RIFOXYA2_FULL_44_8 TaxID=1798696 RepID=A0A1F6NKX8_9BACT|nr:MAG: hypothetical protein A2261_03020 [Candidatus Magasanikbacteria bacterium RIFOXYA2_FULL_44_8]
MQKKIILYILIALALAISLLFLVKEVKLFQSIDITPEEKPLIGSQLMYIPTSEKDPEYGNPGAALVIVEFTDFGCAKCQKIHAILYKFVTAHPLAAKMVWKDVPTSGWFSAGSKQAHEAAYCAFKQNKFWEFTNQVALDRANLKDYNLKKIAEGLKLDMGQWQTCLTADETKNKIQNSMDLASALGVNELPGVFVNNKKVTIPDDVNFEEMLNNFIKE